ncbi:MAG: pyridoxamine 5'-phosphate oxidase family protein [Cellulosilyticaceae bacterium]
MKKTLLVYENKYGFTENIIKKMAMILGPSKICQGDVLKEQHKEFDFIVLGISVDENQINDNMHHVILRNREWLNDKKIALFCTCQKEEDAEKYLKPMQELLKDSLVWTKIITGKVRIDKIAEYGLEIKHLRDHNMTMGVEELKESIDKFLKNHNTCTLSTFGMDKVRSTPIEYNYKDGCLYFVSEGGEKFANILMHSNVSIAIYESYNGMNNLAGMQLSGEAEIIEYDSDDYREFMKMKGISIDKLPVILNLIKVKLVDAEILWSEFKNMGYDIKQYYKY